MEFLKSLLWWEFSIASICIGGLSWWLKDFIRTTMDFSVLLHYISPNFLIAFCALGWLLIRLRKVLSTPVDDLVKILGLEVPVPPIVSLLDLTPTGVIVHWKPAEQRSSVVKYIVKINGITAGEVSHQENAVTISGLPPGRCYTIRIVAINSSTFQASSEAIRIKTSENDVEDQAAADKQKSSDTDTQTAKSQPAWHPAPIVTPCKAFPDTLAAPVAPPMVKELSGSHHQLRRTSGSKRSSPAVQTTSHGSSRERHKEAEIHAALNAKLESIRLQIQEQEKQDEEEEAEFQKSQAALIEQRDALRRQLKERDEESKELNKSVKSLEHTNSAAQNKKSQLEKTLNEKLRAREKMQEDMERWEKEIPLLEEECESLAKQNAEVIESSERYIQATKEEQKPDLQALIYIEEQIQERGKEMQLIDREKKRLEESPEFLEATDRTQELASADRNWNERIANLQAQVNSAMTACFQSQAIFAQTQQRVDMLIAQRGNQTNGLSSPFHVDSQPVTIDTGHSQQSSGMRVNFDLPEQRPYTASLHSRNATGSGTSYRTTSPFLSSVASIPLPQRHQNGWEHHPAEVITGRAMVSPSAGDLLPSGLLGDDPEDIGESQIRETSQHAERTSRSRPTSIASHRLSANFGLSNDTSSADPNYLPGLGTIPGLGVGDTNSPSSPAVSLDSSSPGAIPSPHSSLGNLHHQKTTDWSLESDRTSIRSASGASQNLPVSRRFDFFGRQRGKTASENGPALGSLRSVQSQSMPRDSDDVSQTMAAPRMPLKSSGGLFGQMSSAMLGRRTVTAKARAEAGDSTNPPRAGSVSSFSSQVNPWGRPFAGRRASVSRPGSTYSTENALPAPSVDSPRFGWGVSRESLNRPGNMHSGTGFSNPWSPLPSRRPSIQQEPSGASIREIGDAEDDNDSSLEDQNSPPPAPIGTRPKKFTESDLVNPLNPNARDFTSMFGFGRRSDKGEKDSAKAKKKTKTPAAEDLVSSMADESSPSDSRKSKETFGSSKTGSFDDFRPEEQADITSQTPHERTSLSSPGGRDALMRMLSRKGSSGKFSLPTLRDKGSLFSRKANQVEDNDDESGSSAKLGKSVDSINSNPIGSADKRSSGFSLPSFKKRSKKGGEAPSISETSMTSEASITSGTGDEDEDGPSSERGN